MGKALDVERANSDRQISIWQQAAACEASPSIPRKLLDIQQLKQAECTAEALA